MRDQVYHGPPFPYSVRRFKQKTYTLQHSYQRPEKYITRANPSVREETRRPGGHFLFIGGVFANIVHAIHMALSHTRTVVRACFKGDEASQWKIPKFDPSPR